MKKKVFICILVLLFIFITYITIDCMRLRNSEFGTKPLIMVKEEIGIKDNDENYEKYLGLGYSIKYTYYLDKATNENVIVQTGKGVEFRLFDSILVWAWIE